MSNFKLTSNVAAITAQMRRNAGAVVVATAFEIQGAMRTDMAEPKSGREYRRGSRVHVASAPGESPAVDTGNYTNSLQVEQVGELAAVVGTNAEYAPHLEFGTSKMAPRPVFAPAFEAAAPEFEKRLREVGKV